MEDGKCIFAAKRVQSVTIFIEHHPGDQYDRGPGCMSAHARMPWRIFMAPGAPTGSNAGAVAPAPMVKTADVRRKHGISEATFDYLETLITRVRN